jgi:hypothetical protein
MASPNPMAQYDVIENAKSSRSSCRACRKKIDGGTPRYGLAEPTYDDQVAHLWFHLACGAQQAKGRFQVVYEKYKDLIPGLSELYTPTDAPPARGGFPNIEVASSGRAKCLECNEAIAKGDERLAIERKFEVNGYDRAGAGFLHLKCAPKFTKNPDIVEQARANSVKPKALPVPKAEAPKPAPAPKHDFELGIIAAPDDAAPYLVWADALLTQNDPLGDLIAASTAKKGVFTAALKKHQAAVLGKDVVKAVKDETLTLEWRHGVVCALEVAGDQRNVDDDPTRLSALLIDALSRRVCRFVRKVTVSAGDSYYGNDDAFTRVAWALEPLAKAAPPLLEALTLGTKAGTNPVQVEGVHLVFAACPRLEKLVVRGNAVAWGALWAPALTEVELTTDLTLDTVKAFAAAPVLRSLSLKVERSYVEPAPMVAALAAYAALETLVVRDYVHLDAFAVALAASPLLPRLKKLTLDGRNLAAKGIAALTAKAPLLAKVELKLQNTKASKSSLDALKQALKAARK